MLFCNRLFANSMLCSLQATKSSNWRLTSNCQSATNSYKFCIFLLFKRVHGLKLCQCHVLKAENIQKDLGIDLCLYLYLYLASIDGRRAYKEIPWKTTPCICIRHLLYLYLYLAAIDGRRAYKEIPWKTRPCPYRSL